MAAESQVGTLNPIVLTYSTLINVVNITHDNLVKRKWKMSEASTFLSANGINDKLAAQIVKQGRNCSIYELARERRDKDPERYNKLEKQRVSNPSLVEKASVPSVWDRGLPLKLYIDTPMHLLFLGIAKTVFWYIGVWSGKCGWFDAFEKIGKRNLTDLDNLKLQWLSFNPKTFMKWSGWVSEKFQSLSRVALWIYGPLLDLKDAPTFEEPENLTVDKWLKPHYKKWLKVRGLSDKGRKPELKAKVLAFLAMPIEDQPKVLEIDVNSVPRGR